LDLTEGRPTALGTLEAEVFASTLHPFKHKITSPGGLPRPDWDAELTHLPRDKKVGPNSMCLGFQRAALLARIGKIPHFEVRR